MDSILSFNFRQDLQDIFGFHQFPEEIDEAQPTFGGKKKFRVTNIFLLYGRIKNYS